MKYEAEATAMKAQFAQYNQSVDDQTQQAILHEQQQKFQAQEREKIAQELLQQAQITLSEQKH